MLPIRHNSPKKRVLKKVRPQYLTKKDNSEPTDIDPATHLLNTNQTYILSPTLGLIEKNRKICLGPEYLNLNFKIGTSQIEENLNSKAVTLYVSQIKDNSDYIPWEYTAKRLLSYGDLDLAAWAYRISKHLENYTKAMDKYLESVHMNNGEVFNSLKEADKKAEMACEEIERNYPYYKIVHFMTRESEKLVSLSYNESFLKEIGHSVESFMRLAKKNGIPQLFESNCDLYIDMLKKIFDGTLRSFRSFFEAPEFIADLLGEDGSKRKVLAQFVNFFRPDYEGFYVCSYLVLKERKFDKAVNTYKCIKGVTDTEEEINELKVKNDRCKEDME